MASLQMTQITPRTRYKQLLERKRQVRRRQVVRRVAAGMLLVLIVLVVVLSVVGIRSCANRHAAPASQAGRPARRPPKVGKIELVFAHDFHPGPKFVALDDQRIYVGAAMPPKPKDPPSTLLAAFAFGDRDAQWQAPIQGTLGQLGLSGGAIIGVPDSGGNLLRYNGADGKGLTEVDADPSSAELAMDSRLVLLGYAQRGDNGKPAIRLLAFDAKTGKYQWRVRSRLAGFSGGNDECCGPQPKVELDCWEGLCAYRLHNVLGMVNSNGGKLVRPEFAAPGHIWALQLDRQARTAYIIAADDKDATMCRLIRVPLDSASKPRRLLEFRTQLPAQALVYGEGGGVLLAYTSEAGKGKLVCFGKDSGTPALMLDADAGVADMSAVPGEAGVFLAATTSRFQDGQPSGASRILRIQLGSAQPSRELAHYRQPATWVVPFKRDCLVLVQGGGFSGGGQIERYSADTGRLGLLRRAKYPLLEPLHSARETSLMISSYPESYALDQGGPLQVLVFQ